MRERHAKGNARAREWGKERGSSPFLRPSLMRFLLARFASPFAASLARSRVACFARHLKCRACSQAREEAASFTGERVSISIVGLM